MRRTVFGWIPVEHFLQVAIACAFEFLLDINKLEIKTYFVLVIIHHNMESHMRENHHCEKHGNTQISLNISHKL
jgi:hypothetical protein